MFVPKTIWFIYEVNILSRDDWSKESWNNSVITNNHDTTNDGYWGTVEFSITDHEVLRRISPEHKLVFIISDGMFTHSNNFYWLETLPFSIHITGGGKYPMTIIAKMRSEKLKNDSYVLKTDIFLDDNLKVTYDGFPVFMYAINTIITREVKYDWADTELELQEILNLLNMQYSNIETADLPNALARVDTLSENLKTQINTVHELQVKVEIPTIQAEVKNELMLNIQNQGSSFWGTLFGGWHKEH